MGGSDDDKRRKKCNFVDKSKESEPEILTLKPSTTEAETE